jgi:hypothetical protein
MPTYLLLNYCLDPDFSNLTYQEEMFLEQVNYV